MPLIKDGTLIEDAWIAVADDAALTDAPAIVSLERFQAERDSLLARDAAIGVRLRPDQSPFEIAEDLGAIGIIALEFPAFKDGRAYSHARLLRERLGYKGEIRAVGDVLRDQLLFMQRCGFNAFEVKDGLSEQSVSQAMEEFSVFYQTAADGRPTIREQRNARAKAA